MKTIEAFGQTFEYTDENPYVSLTELIRLGNIQLSLDEAEEARLLPVSAYAKVRKRARWQMSQFTESRRLRDFLVTLASLAAKYPNDPKLKLPLQGHIIKGRETSCHVLLALFLIGVMEGKSDCEATGTALVTYYSEE